MASSLRSGRSEVRIQAREKYFYLFSETSRPSLGPNQPPINGHRGSFQAVQRPGRDVQRSLPSSAEVKNKWSYTFTPSTCLHGVDRNSCIFLTFFKARKFGNDKRYQICEILNVAFENMRFADMLAPSF